jgi:6-phosphofructokinase
VIENIRTLGIDGIVAIGGDGTLRIAQRLCDMGIPMVAVPKTIDNDLAATDYTRSKFDIIVVAEGAKREGGEESYLDKSTRRLGGIAYQVAADIAQHIDLEIRVTVLGHIQRGGSPVAFDRVLATRFGAAAGRLVQKGDFGKMVALRGEDIVAVPIRDAVAQMKYVDPNGPLVASARGVGISFGDGK